MKSQQLPEVKIVPYLPGALIATSSTHVAVVDGQGKVVWIPRKESLEEHALRLAVPGT